MGCPPSVLFPAHLPAQRGVDSAGWCCSAPMNRAARQADVRLACSTYFSNRTRCCSNLVGVLSGEVFLRLFPRALFSARISHVGNHPLPIYPDKIEQVSPAVIDLAIHQKFERCPHYREVVVDAHQRIVNALLDRRLAGLADGIDRKSTRLNS